MSVKVFWLTETDLCRVRLRCYETRPGCSSGRDYCEADVVIHERAPVAEWTEALPDEGGRRSGRRSRDELVPATDPAWPSSCAACARPFGEAVTRQVWTDEFFSGAPDGNLYTLRDCPPGAMWDAWWMDDWFRGPDGICLMVRLPNGSDWMVDSEASNCTKPQREVRDGRTYLTERTHFCWVRHGDPRTGQVHVDKNGNTCSAGAGSIQSGDYHGFLHDGYLT